MNRSSPCLARWRTAGCPELQRAPSSTRIHITYHHAHVVRQQQCASGQATLFLPAHHAGPRACGSVRHQQTHDRAALIRSRVATFNQSATTLEVQKLESSQGTTLEELHIKDFALVTEQRLRLAPGLNVITGESGAGKSVLLESLNQLLGAPSPADCVRPPAQAALVEGSFRLSAQAAAAARQLLQDLGLPQRALPEAAAGARLMVRREVSIHEGSLRSRCTVNGSPTSLRVLRLLGALLVDANGQHSSLSLKDGATQLALLDRVAGTSSLVASFSSLQARAVQLEEQLEVVAELGDEEERDRLQRLVDQVERARVQQGEERAIRARLRQAELRRTAVEQCGLAVLGISGEGGGGGLTGAIRAIQAQLNSIVTLEQRAAGELQAAGVAPAQQGSMDEEDDVAPGSSPGGGGDSEEEEGALLMEEALEALAQAQELASRAGSLVGQYALLCDYSEQEQAELRDRLAVLEKLMRAHGCRGSEQLLELAAEAGQRLEAFYDAEGDAEAWEAELEEVEEEMVQVALELSSRRRAAAEQLRTSVDQCLADLAMGNSRFDVRLSWEVASGSSSYMNSVARVLEVIEEEAAGVGEAEGRFKVQSSGLDRVEFLLAAGPAEPLRPLAAVASGGESARIMLALKAAPATAALATLATDAPAAAGAAEEQQQESEAGGGQGSGALSGPPIMVLDELDSGIGSRLGQSVGTLLRRMCAPPAASNSQILCVTHLPQVAAHALHHVKVSKQQDGEGRASTVFSQLEEPSARLEEVAAMLGLGTDVAADMMAAAQGWPSQQVQQLLAGSQPAEGAGSGAGQQGVELEQLVAGAGGQMQGTTGQDGQAVASVGGQ